MQFPYYIFPLMQCPCQTLLLCNSFATPSFMQLSGHTFPFSSQAIPLLELLLYLTLCNPLAISFSYLPFIQFPYHIFFLCNSFATSFNHTKPLLYLPWCNSFVTPFLISSLVQFSYHVFFYAISLPYLTWRNSLAVFSLMQFPHHILLGAILLPCFLLCNFLAISSLVQFSCCVFSYAISVPYLPWCNSLGVFSYAISLPYPP